MDQSYQEDSNSESADENSTLDEEFDEKDVDCEKREEEIRTSTTTLALETQRNATHFTRLGMETDLNLPPSNWLRTAPPFLPPGLSMMTGFDPINPDEKQSPFASFRMADEYIHLLGDVDVITASENIKKLIKAAISSGGLSMMIHKIGDTLMIDNFDIHKWLLRPIGEWDWLRQVIFLLSLATLR